MKAPFLVQVTFMGAAIHIGLAFGQVFVSV